MDRHWEALRSEVPWVKRRPSAYVNERVRFTTQPCEEPPDPKHFEMILDLIGGYELMLFSSDYPHWDYDDPKWTLARIPAAHREAVKKGNALGFYNTLPEIVDALPDQQIGKTEAQDFPAVHSWPTAVSD